MVGGGGTLKELEFAIDTGSSWIWTFKELCFQSNWLVKKFLCGSRVRGYSYSYLDGTIDGQVYKTNFYLGQQQKLRGVEILVIDGPANLVNTPLLGLLSRSDDHLVFVQQLIKNKIIKENKFSIDLVRFGYENDSLVEKRNNFKITFGSLKYKTRLIGHTDILQPLGYSVLVERVRVNGYKLSNKIRAVIDSGNTLLALPAYMKEYILNLLNERENACHGEKEQNLNFEFIRCQEARGVPDLYFVFRNFEIKIDSGLVMKRAGGQFLSQVEFH